LGAPCELKFLPIFKISKIIKKIAFSNNSNMRFSVVWKSQFATSNRDKMGLRRRLYAFTEQGVAMLSSVLNSNGLFRSILPLCEHL